MQDYGLIYTYIFLFETIKTDLYAIYGEITHYQLFNQDRYIIIYGTTSKRKTIVYDELDALHWMSKNFTHDYKVYFYRDPEIPTYIYISTKENLHNKQLFPQYDLIQLSLETWRSGRYKRMKQFILFNDGKITSNQLDSISQIQDINKKYILSTI